MSFKRLEPEDFLISTDAVVAPAFANGSSDSSGGAAANSGVSLDYYTAYPGADGRIEYYVTIEATRNATGANVKKDVVYKQFANIIQGDAETALPIGESFYATVIDRQRFKQSIFPPTFDVGGLGPLLTGSADVTYGIAGRVFRNATADFYAYPDIGVALTTDNPGGGAGAIVADSEEVITSNFIFVRARNAEFNYSQNPTFVDTETGGVRFTDFITAPQTFITTVGLYNDNGDCLAVAKLSKPLKKDFTKEALIRVKLDF